MGSRRLDIGRMIPWRLILLGNFLWSSLVTITTATVCAKVRMGVAWPWIVFLIALIILGSALLSRKIPVTRAGILTIGAVVVFLMWALSPYLFRGYLLTSHPDLWGYCAGAEYLTRFVRGTAPGNVPLYIFAAMLSDSRFGTFSVLAFLGSVFHTDTIYLVACYAALLLFNVFWGVALLTRLFGAKPIVSLVAGSYAVVCGLIPDTAHYGELDNLLFLSILPFVIIRLELFLRGGKLFPSILGLALSASATFYAYPEGVAVAGVIFLPFFIFSLLKLIWQPKFWRYSLIFVALFLSFTAPYLPTFSSFLSHQLYVGAAAYRIGQNALSGLISTAFLPSMFGFGDEFGIGPFEASHLALAMVCLAFLLFAIVAQRKKRRFVIFASVFLITLCGVWQGLVLRYDYGFFKFLVVSSLLTTPLIFCGIQLASRLGALERIPVLAPGFALLVAISAFAERRERYCDYFSTARRQIRPYEELKTIGKIAGEAPVRLSFEASHPPRWDDGVDQLWAAYFLRDLKLDIPDPKLYLEDKLGYAPYKTWQEEVDPSVKFFLSNRPQKNAVWSNKIFFLTTESPQG
jgi:hypothetical protein